MINIFQKNNKTLRFTYKRSDGTPVNVSGYTLSFICKKLTDNSNNNDNAVIPKKTILLTGSNAENGIFSLSLSEEDTNIEVGTYKAQFELIKTDVRVTFLQDNLSIIKNIDKE